jgi:flagellar motility protein MotE (MotC chaperone)
LVAKEVTDLEQNEIEEDYEAESGGRFARFLFFIAPIIFTIVLLSVLLTLLNVNFRNVMLDWGNRIPIVRDFIPEPDGVAGDDNKKEDKEQGEKKQRESTDATVKQLKEQVAKQESDLKAANQQATEEAEKAKALQATLDQERSVKQKAEQSEEQAAYQKEVKKLAQLYAQMSPKKAAAIIEKLTTDEALQMLSQMGNENKAAILEKMDAQKAADISIKLKDATTSEDLNIAALQSRLKKEAETDAAASKVNTGLTDAQLSATFSTMSADSASELLLQTYKISPDKALKILNSIDDAARSKILASMTKSNQTEAAKILNKLVAK